VRARVHEGYTTFKAKVGRENVDSDARGIEALRSLANEASIRLDANRAFAASGLAATLERFARWRPAYIEEPVRDMPLSALGNLAVACAADESLAEPRERRALLRPTSSCRLPCRRARAGST
jgi:L-alanine-DL-glutamate epimerase-like enolase superfamily enzyme